MQFNHARYTTLLNEGTSLETTIRAIINDANEPVAQTYATLKRMATKYFAEHGTMRGFGMVAGGVSRRWYDTHYFDRLSKELHHLTRYAPESTRSVAAMLSLIPTKFSEISDQLPEALMDVGKRLRDDRLVTAAQNWKRERESYNTHRANILRQAKAEEQGDTDDEEQAATKNYKQTVNKQYDAVEGIVNNVLKSLPSGIAGDIRNMIAKSPNKLQALEQELDRRGIKL